MYRFTNSTHALQISPPRGSERWKQLEKKSSYFPLDVKRELLDLALQMQHPSAVLYSFGLWNAAMAPSMGYGSGEGEGCI